MIIRNGTAGAIKDKVTEDMLISYLENFQDQQTTTITFKRKIDDEDDIDADIEGL
jgi:DNA-binding TFAR19-related protein (PDSD5 family)